MDEKTYLEQYGKRGFSTPLISVDPVLFTYHEQCLKVLLVQRSNHPDLGKWGLPGGFIDPGVDTTLEHTVARKLKDKTGVVPPYIEQLCTMGNASRDKRGWSVTVCYTALIAHQNCTISVDTVSDAGWINIEDLSELHLAFDHAAIIDAARERLRQKALYSIVPAYGLPDKFTLPQLQQLHELLIGRQIQKKSFRRRIEKADLLEDTGEKLLQGGRPAALYRLKKEAGEFTFLRNLSS